MFIVSRPIRSEVKPQEITAKPQYALATTWFKLAFSSHELAFLPTNLQKPNYRIRNRPEATVIVKIYNGTSFRMKASKLQKKYGSKITNHSLLAWPFELHVKHNGQPRFWLVCYFLLSDALSSLVWSFLLDSTSLSRNMSLNISFISIPCI